MAPERDVGLDARSRAPPRRSSSSRRISAGRSPRTRPRRAPGRATGRARASSTSSAPAGSPAASARAAVRHAGFEALGVELAGRDGQQIPAADRPQRGLGSRRDAAARGSCAAARSAICTGLSPAAAPSPQSASWSSSLETARLACRSRNASSASCRGPPAGRRRSPARSSIGPRIPKVAMCVFTRRRRTRPYTRPAPGLRQSGCPAVAGCWPAVTGARDGAPAN